MGTVRDLTFALAVVSLGLVVTGTKACREDYDLGSNVRYGDTDGTPTPTPTDETDDETGDELVTPTPTPTTSPTPTPTATATATPTATPIPTATAVETLTFELRSSISNTTRSLLEDVAEEVDARAGLLVGVGEEGEASANWLGELGQNTTVSDGPASSLVDTDSDGFSDKAEIDIGTDPYSPDSYPQLFPGSDWAARMAGSDDDVDGIQIADERLLGLDPALFDTDGDGCGDGAEILSGSNPLDALDSPIDSDADCLSDEYEQKIGTLSGSRDSDKDGLEDAQEFVFGTNPLLPDTDGDGIFDGHEVELGADPTVPHSLIP
jgi:hypothetical protein